MKMRYILAGWVLIVMGAMPTFGHGPQMQITNDNNKITTRAVYLDEPYNVIPNPPSNPTSVYIMPLAPINSFGGTAYWVQPDAGFPVSSPGIAWTYGWTYDTSAHTTFPAGANFVESLVGGLKKHDGSSFVTAPNGAQLQIFKTAANSGVSGSASPLVNLKAIAAPTSAVDNLLDDHTTVSFQLLGDGIVPSASHVPGAVGDGIYLAELKLGLNNQPATADPRTPLYNPSQPIQDSDSFYFVLYKGVSVDSALAAAQGAFPSASIQVVPEPALVGGVMVGLFWLYGRRRSG